MAAYRKMIPATASLPHPVLSQQMSHLRRSNRQLILFSDDDFTMVCVAQMRNDRLCGDHHRISGFVMMRTRLRCPVTLLFMCQLPLNRQLHCTTLLFMTLGTMISAANFAATRHMMGVSGYGNQHIPQNSVRLRNHEPRTYDPSDIVRLVFRPRRNLTPV